MLIGHWKKKLTGGPNYLLTTTIISLVMVVRRMVTMTMTMMMMISLLMSDNDTVDDDYDHDGNGDDNNDCRPTSNKCKDSCYTELHFKLLEFKVTSTQVCQTIS